MKRPLHLLLPVALLALAVVPAADARDPHRPAVKPVAAEVAIAKTMLLTKADMAANLKDTGVDRSGNGPTCSSYDPDMHKLVETANVNGHNFEQQTNNGYQAISTEAVVYQSRADALTDWRATIANPKQKACLVELLTAGFGKGAKIASLHVSPIDLKTNGMTIRVWDMNAVLSSNGQKVPMELVASFYLKGRAAAVLLLATAGNGITAKQARNLSALVTTRVAHAASQLH